MIHIGDISVEKRLNHPSDALKVGEVVKALVLEVDRERRRFKLGIKQLQPTSIDDYLAEHRAGDKVSGRVMDVSGNRIKVELGEGVTAFAPLPEQRQQAAAAAPKADLSSLSAMLANKWKSGGGESAGAEALRAGQVRSFKIVSLDPEKKKIELEFQA